MRQVNRLREIGGNEEEEARLLEESAMSYHQRRLDLLPALRPFAEWLMEDQGTTPEMLTRRRDQSQAVRQEWREQITQVDVGASDASHLQKMVDDCCDSLDDDGLRSLGRHLSGAIDALDETRRLPDRGTYEASIPPWMIAIAGVVLGISICAAISLANAGAPWWSFFLLALLAYLLLLLPLWAIRPL